MEYVWIIFNMACQRCRKLVEERLQEKCLKKGSVVSPAPVIPVSRFKLEKSEDDEHQLLRNYCYGHFASIPFALPVRVISVFHQPRK
jgi:hypothetical protein